MPGKKSVEELEKELKKLKAENNNLFMIFESNPHGIALIDKNGKYVYVNSCFTELTGYTLQDIPNKQVWFEKVYPDENYRKQITATWSSDHNILGMGELRQFKIRCKNGKSKYIEFRTTHSKDQTISVLTDITKRKKAEDALKESEERLKTIFGTNPDPAAVYNDKGYPLYLNAAFIETFGWTLKELQGRRIPFVPKDQAKLAHDKINEIYRTGEPVRFETKRLSKQGEIIDVLLSAAILKNAKGIHNGLIVNLKNISERKRLENQLQHAQKMEAIGTLAGGIAHDFNNILFPILGNTEILLMDTPEDSDTHNRLQKIYSGASRARDLVKQILIFSRQEDLELRRVKLQPIIKETVDFIRSAMPGNIKVKEDISNDCGSVKADSTQIHQIIMNLTTNASYAIGDDRGEIKITLKEIKFSQNNQIGPDMKAGTYIYLAVSDTGKGMDKELQTKIFDPFFTTKEKGRGTGMGLATVHGIVKNMNGIVQVSSKPGKGSKFKIYFPLTKF